MCLQKDTPLWPTFFFFGKRFSLRQSSLIPPCEDLGFCHIVYISRLHTLPTQQELQSAPFQIGRWNGWRLTYPETALPMPNPQECNWHDLRSFCAFLLSALAESPLNFFIFYFFSQPCPHSMNLIYSSSSAASHRTSLKNTPYFINLSAFGRQKIKDRPRLINSGGAQSSRFLMLFIFKSCDLPSLWSCSMTRLRDHGLFFSPRTRCTKQDTVTPDPLPMLY